MKKRYIRTIIRFSGKDCVLIILFQLFGSKTRLFKTIYSRWVIVPANLHIGITTNPIFI